MWIAKTKRKIALSLFGAELELTKWELKMKPRWREVVKTWWLIVLTFFLCWSLRFIWIFKTFVFFLDFDKFRTRRLNDRKMFAFYVQVKWQEISYLFVFVSLHILFCLFFVGRHDLQRHKQDEITEIDPTNRTYTNLKPGISQINTKKMEVS